MTDLINANEMSNEAIYGIFKAAYMKPELGGEGDVRVNGPSGIQQVITVDDENKLMKFMSIFGFEEGRSREEKLELINRLNSGIVFSRFSIPREDILLVDYYLAYEEGVMPLQIMNSMHWFDKVTIGAIRAYDESNLIK